MNPSSSARFGAVGKTRIAAFVIVAQNSNLLYRRIAFGSAPSLFVRSESVHRLRIENPRYGRVQLCATKGEK
jgi:hypothetical protein